MATPAAAYGDRILRRNGRTWKCTRSPPAWSQHRQELVDSTEWFKTAQSGLQATLKAQARNNPDDYYTTGLLISCHGSGRTYWDAEIIITSLHGEHNPDGSEASNRREATKNAMAQKRLIGVIIDNKAAFPIQPKAKKGTATKPSSVQVFPCNNMAAKQGIWVAGWFLVTDMWTEKVYKREQSGSNDAYTQVTMIRLQKWDLETQSWYADQANGLPPPIQQRDFAIAATEEVCGACNTKSTRRFNEHFLCCNQSCAAFWMVNGHDLGSATVLTYTDRYLKQRVDPRQCATAPKPSMYPRLHADFSTWWQSHWLQKQGEPLTMANVQERTDDLLSGFCCPDCNMLNCRIDWHQWRCRNKQCGYTKPGYPPVLSMTQLALFDGTVMPDFRSFHTFVQETDLPLFTAYRYELHPDCYVTYLRPKPGTNAIQKGSDYFYQRFRDLAGNGTIKLSRRLINTPAGMTRTGHFNVNFGKDYSFGVSTPTTPFAAAPREVLEAVSRANEWTADIRTESGGSQQQALNFNEMYIGGYMKDQKMTWHDDGESGLGDVIVTWTLGGRGDFQIALKRRLDYGRPIASNGISRTARWITDDPVIKGCLYHDQRRALKDQLNSGAITQAQWMEAFKTLMSPHKGTKHNVVLRLPVFHGCILVMHGKKMQEYFDHRADVETPLRLALTFRHLTDAHVPNQKARAELERKCKEDEWYEESNNDNKDISDPPGDPDSKDEDGDDQMQDVDDPPPQTRRQTRSMTSAAQQGARKRLKRS